MNKLPIVALLNTIEVVEDEGRLEFLPPLLEMLNSMVSTYVSKRLPNTPTQEEMEIGMREGKIPAIKAHRARTGLGLKDSKEMLEGYFYQRGVAFKGYRVDGTPFPH